MRGRLLSVSLLLVAGTLAACFNDRAAPTQPLFRHVGTSANATLAADGCLNRPPFYTGGSTDPRVWFTNTDLRVKTLINALFIGDNLQSTLSMWENLKKDKLGGNPIQSHIDNMGKFTLTQFAIGGLRDPFPELAAEGPLNQTTGSVRLLDLVFTCANLVPTSLPTPPPGFDGAFKLLEKSETLDQQVNTTSGHAASWVPRGALNARSLLVMAKQPDDQRQVNTPFPTLSRTVDVALAGGKLNLKSDGTHFGVSVLVCPDHGPLNDHDASSPKLARSVIAHQRRPFQPGDNVGVGVEYLPTAEGGTLTCLDGHDGLGSTWRQEKGFFKRRAMQLASYASKAWQLIGPKPLYAGHAAIGGILGAIDGDDGFSPIVIVDPYVETGITDVSIPATTYGEPVVVNATLRITNVPATCGLATSPAVCGWVGQPVTQSLAGMPALTLSALKVRTTLDDGKTDEKPIGTSGTVQFSFSHVNAGDTHSAHLAFPRTANLVCPGVPPVATCASAAMSPLFETSAADQGFVVAKRDLVVTAANKTKVYGDANPPLDGTLVGVQYDEPITAVYHTDVVDNTEVSLTAADYPITANVSATDALLANYILAKHDATLTITKAPLSISASNYERRYGNANPTFGGSIEGIKNSDVITLTFATDAITLSAIGGYPIVPTAHGDRLARNYDVTPHNGTLTIVRRPVTVTADAKSRDYGLTNPTLTGVVTGDGLVATDGVTDVYSTTATQVSDVGGYPITPALSGPASGNYEATLVPATLSVLVRELTGAIDNKSRNVGQDNPAFTGTVNGLFAGDGVTTTFVAEATAASPAGDYPITLHLNGAHAGSYISHVTPGILTILAGDPSPDLAYKFSEQFSVDGIQFDRYRFTVTNRASYSASLFAPRPGATSCVSKTRVDFFDAATDAYIYGFCSFGSPDDLDNIWFAVPRWAQPPAGVYIKFIDQTTGVAFLTSNTVQLYGPLFTNYPRTVELDWAPVANAAVYTVEVEYCESWASPDWRTCTASSAPPATWLPQQTTSVTAPTTSLVHTFVGDQPGRWRVGTTDAAGIFVGYSAYKYFKYLTP